MRKPMKRPQRLRLLRDTDWNTSLREWRDPIGALGMVNPKGWGILHVVVQERRQGRWHDLYDRPLWVGVPAAIVVATVGDKIAMIQNYRLNGERLGPKTGADYIRHLQKTGRWEELVDSLGKWVWELPRGIAPGGDASDMEKFMVRVARMEAAEEAGFRLADVKVCGRMNMDTSFRAHCIYVVRGRIVGRGKNNPEEGEAIGRVRLFSRREIRRMIDRGEIEDGNTLAALHLAKFHV